MMNNDSVVVKQLSNTQRISLKPNKDSITIQKEHRKSSDADWMIGKGIELSRDIIPVLIGQLNTL